MQTSPETAVGAKRGARGRRDAGQESVIKLETIKTRADQLIKLKKTLDEAAEDYASAIKQAAEDSGLLAATVRKFIDARAGEKFDETKDKVVQLALVFEEVGIDSGK